MPTLTEPARDLPVVAEYDVAVCGGGPAGVAAALAAARTGARTILIEYHGSLGGVWTAGSLTWILDHDNKKGIMPEILAALQARGARGKSMKGAPSNAYDVEVMKQVLDQLCAEAGVAVQLYSRVAAALVNAEGALTHVVTESKSGREAVAAKVFVDCTGDGDLAAQAGCGFDFGNPDTGKTQPMTLMALVTGIDRVAIDAYYRDYDDGKPWGQTKDALRAEMVRGGNDPSYQKPTLFPIHNDLFGLMANHEYGVSALDVRDLTAATTRARAEVHRLVDGLRSLGGVWADLRIVATGAQIGVREGRRIHGRYTVVVEDLRDGARHEDAVCRVQFGIDVHATDPSKTKGIEPQAIKSQPYDIPLRALIAADVEGLLLAGRCISGDFLAHSSYRVTGNSVALGEAAGVTAALAAAAGCAPSALPWSAIAPHLPGVQ